MSRVFRALRRHWDALFSALVAVEIAIFVPGEVSNAFAAAIYEIGISVLSIIFSVFFAALAVVMAAGDDEFVVFLREHGFYEKIIAQFRQTLSLLFGALVYSIVAFGVTAWLQAYERPAQHWAVFILFVFLFIYGLLASVLAVTSSLRYAKSRLEYLTALRGSKRE